MTATATAAFSPKFRDPKSVADVSAFTWEVRSAACIGGRIEFRADGTPVNPHHRPASADRSPGMCRAWGPNQCADALIVADVATPTGPARHVAVVVRSDGQGVALPGGHREYTAAGTYVGAIDTAITEAAEEIHLPLPREAARVVGHDYVPDARESACAWQETTVVRVDLAVDALPELIADDDAAAAMWVPGSTVAEVSAFLAEQGLSLVGGHRALLARYL